MSEARAALLARFRTTLRARLQRVADSFQVTGAAPELERRNQALAELHTLKGEARLLGLRQLALLAHELESSVAEQPFSADRSRALDEMRLALEEDAAPAALNAGRQECGLRVGQAQAQAMLSEWARHAQVLAAESGKQLRVATRVGQGAELEGENLEELWPALLHLLQNALDHGLESPHERGDKPREGRLTLSAEVQASSLVLAVEDDGRGIDLDAIRCAALLRGVRETSQLAAQSQSELLELLFEPGFSTRAAVTPLSGRGVGLDAARRQVEALGGRIGVETELGHGTRFVISVPARPSAR